MPTKIELEQIINAARDRVLAEGTTKVAFVGGMMYRDAKNIQVGGVRVTIVPGCKRMDIQRLANGNPVLGTDDDGVVYRYHGEIQYVMDDLKTLAGI